MKRLIFVLFLFLVISFFATCKRENIGEYDPNYIGEWHSDTFTTSSGEQREIYFIINGDNSELGFMCLINCSPCPCQILTRGKAIIRKNHKVMIIGSGNGQQRAKIKLITPPYQDANGKWKCVIKDAGDSDITMYKR